MVLHFLNLQRLYTETAQYQRAESFGVRALALARKIHGPGHFMVADGCTNLGVVYLHMGEFAKADALLLEALQIDEQLHGKEHVVTASVLDRLGVLYDNTGAYRKAERFLQRALAIHEKASGPTHEVTARTLEHLGVLSQHMGNYALWLSGLFPDYLERRRWRRGGPDLEYFEEMGRKGYEAAARHRLANEHGLDTLFGRVAERFPVLRVALNRISDTLLFPDHNSPDRLMRQVRDEFRWRHAS